MRESAALSALLLFSSPFAFAQSPADVFRAQADAARLLASGPKPDERGRRTTPDADDFAEPKEALGNFRQVAPGFYRSAQPSSSGYAQLRDLGVKTILSFKDGADQERREAGSYGMTVENVPMSGFSAPSFDEVDRALDIIAVAPRPLLVHCQRGKDRTGFVVASYRVTVEKMPVDDAVQEAYDYGCCFIPFGDLTKFLTGYRSHRRSVRHPAAPHP